MEIHSLKIDTQLSIDVSKDWADFLDWLVETLSNLDENQFLVISKRNSNQFVQFAAQGQLGMRAEASSNNYLSNEDELDAIQIAHLIRLGWQSPTGTALGSTPELDPQGSPNFYCEFKDPICFETVGKLTTRTLTEVFNVNQLSLLDYEIYDEHGNLQENTE